MLGGQTTNKKNYKLQNQDTKLEIKNIIRRGVLEL